MNQAQDRTYDVSLTISRDRNCRTDNLKQGNFTAFVHLMIERAVPKLFLALVDRHLRHFLNRAENDLYP